MRYSQFLPRIFCILVLVLAVLMIVLPAGPAGAQNSISVILHYVEGKPIPEKLAYEVHAFVSVLDASGNPMRGLQAGDFQLNEDANGMTVDSASTAENEPVHLILVLDTSGTMYPNGIKAARQAAQDFIDGLGKDDRVALISFNEQITRDVDPTTDHQVIKDHLAGLNAVPNAGTCIYDAAFTSIQLAAALPAGQRAIILLTDGKDELLNREPCSSHTIDDVIGQAFGGSTRVPIYTIGIREGSDGNSLKRLAEMTGGIYRYSPTDQKISETFTRISDQLKSEYILKYQSAAGQGAHSLMIQVKTGQGTGQDARNFLLPALPPSISIVLPEAGQQISGKIKIVAAVNAGGGEPVSRVHFYFNGASIGTKSGLPYEYEWDTPSLSEGSRVIRVTAENTSGKVLASAETTVRLVAAAPVPAPTSEPTETTPATATALPVEEKSKFLSGQPVLAGILIGGLGVVIIIAALFFATRRKSTGNEPQPEPQLPAPAVPKPNQAPTYVGTKKVPDSSLAPSGSATIQMSPVLVSEMTVNEPLVKKPAGILCLLTIKTSGDVAAINRIYRLDHLPARIGRSSECEVEVPKKDQTVSRFHAQLSQEGSRITVGEIASLDENGQQRLPRYHTFVNDVQIPAEPVALKTGDRIRLGSELTLEFESCLAEQPAEAPDERTIDELDIDPDATLDDFQP